MRTLVTAVGVIVAAQLVGACCCCPKAASAAPDVPASAGATAGTPLIPNAAGAVVAVKTCPGALVPAADGLVDDLEDNNNQVQQIAGRGGYWWSGKDDKGSTIEPSGEMKMSEGGAHGSKFAVHVTGKT